MPVAIDYKSYLSLNTIYNYGFTGQNVGIAILDTGASLHEDLSHLVVFQDYVNHLHYFYDDNGHGTHVAGIINSKRFGIAPGSHLIILKVLNQLGEGKTAQVLQGINWIIDHKDYYGIRIMNISIGTSLHNRDTSLALLAAVERAWNHGIIVVSAAGNHGPQKASVTTPGTSPKIITVGACDDTSGNQHMLSYSGRGPTGSCICKPDVVAPGSKILSCLNQKQGYTEKSGTSMATPFVSGCIALLLCKEPTLTPKQVKLRLYETSLDLGLPQTHQGWGLINPRGLLRI